MNNYIFLFYIICAVILILFIVFRKKFKTPIVGSLALVDGAVKSGKTTFSLHLARRNYIRSVFRWRIKCILLRVFLFKKKCDLPERPLFYSTTPVGFPYVQITKSLILRKTRPNYGSTFFIQEASLLADNSIYKDLNITEPIMLFNKLFGHETHGGMLVYDTQSIADLPAVTRRCLGQTFYVHHLIKWIPFVILAFVKEQRYSEDGTVVQVEAEDIQDQEYKIVLIPKTVWKKFDCYCYSTFTDNLPVENTVLKPVKRGSLKATNIISFKDWKHL